MTRPYSARIDALRRGMLRSGRRAVLDGILVTNLTNIGYLSGFPGSAAILLITPDEAIFITDGRYASFAAQTCPEYAVVEAGGSGGYGEAVADALKARPNLKALGFESAQVTVDQLTGWRKDAPEGVRWKPAAGRIERLRMIKSDEEVAAIREAVRIAEASFATVQEHLKPNVSERDFALELEYTMRRMGADAPSFDTIVASGESGASPHHHASHRKFQPGDLVTIDWGARAYSYCSDITRTVAIPGKSAADELRRIHQIVLDAMNRAIDACIPGANGRHVDSVARDVITAAGYGTAFKHSLGHSIGREVHDGLTLAQRAGSVTLEPGIVTTVEPGIYIDGLGGVRIEEDVLVTEAGPVVLTSRSPAL